MAGIPKECPLVLRQMCALTARIVCYSEYGDESEIYEEKTVEDFVLRKSLPKVPNTREYGFTKEAMVRCQLINQEECMSYLENLGAVQK